MDKHCWLFDNPMDALVPPMALLLVLMDTWSFLFQTGYLLVRGTQAAYINSNRTFNGHASTKLMVYHIDNYAIMSAWVSMKM
ncbi:hypothetical protein DFP73DRAFT_536088 [Morchella snyderi]|nr:hypothetical protein DFP73DRAFT_536088 [Morchella snyderi]